MRLTINHSSKINAQTYFLFNQIKCSSAFSKLRLREFQFFDGKKFLDRYFFSRFIDEINWLFFRPTVFYKILRLLKSVKITIKKFFNRYTHNRIINVTRRREFLVNMCLFFVNFNLVFKCKVGV